LDEHTLNQLYLLFREHCTFTIINNIKTLISQIPLLDIIVCLDSGWPPPIQNTALPNVAPVYASSKYPWYIITT